MLSDLRLGGCCERRASGRGDPGDLAPSWPLVSADLGDPRRLGHHLSCPRGPVGRRDTALERERSRRQCPPQPTVRDPSVRPGGRCVERMDTRYPSGHHEPTCIAMARTGRHHPGRCLDRGSRSALGAGRKTVGWTGIRAAWVGHRADSSQLGRSAIDRAGRHDERSRRSLALAPSERCRGFPNKPEWAIVSVAVTTESFR
jgi:hypothetical protein